MKFLIVALAFVMCAYADVSELGYSYQEPAAPAPGPGPVEPERSYIPPTGPVQEPAPIDSYVPPAQPQPAPAPLNSYLAPEPSVPHSEEPVNSYIPPAEQPIAPLEEIEQTPEDGYQYKTVRRVVYRHRV